MTSYYLEDFAAEQRFISGGRTITEADNVRQPLSASVGKRHVPSAAEDSKLSMFGCDAEIGQAGQFQASRKSCAIDSADDRLEYVGLPSVTHETRPIVDKPPPLVL